MLVLTALWLLPILLIRAQPYEDRAGPALAAKDCPSPCFMGIRPGVITMRDAIYILQSHPWVANGPYGFPAHVRDAVFFDAALPRTTINLRWTPALPAWIDTAQTGGLMVEDWDVLGLTIGTHLSLGEIFLAFGDPDEARFAAAEGASGRRFAYSAWYAGLGLFISAEGLCPTRHYYDIPVRVLFRPESPGFSESVPKDAVC
jgi:hypothetical protein